MTEFWATDYVKLASAQGMALGGLLGLGAGLVPSFTLGRTAPLLQRERLRAQLSLAKDPAERAALQKQLNRVPTLQYGPAETSAAVMSPIAGSIIGGVLGDKLSDDTPPSPRSF